MGGAVILLETEEKPPDSAAYYIAERCDVKPENVNMVLTSTTSLAGMVQISGRIVETGLFRLDILGLDLKKVKYGAGFAPICLFIQILEKLWDVLRMH